MFCCCVSFELNCRSYGKLDHNMKNGNYINVINLAIVQLVRCKCIISHFCFAIKSAANVCICFVYFFRMKYVVCLGKITICLDV